MQRLPVAVSIFTVLFFVFSLTGNLLIADPDFTSVAFAQKKKDKDKDDDKNALKGNKRLRAAVSDLQTRVTGLEATDPVPGPQGETGPAGPQGIAGPTGTQGPAGATGATGAVGGQGSSGLTGGKGDKGETGPQGPQGQVGFQGPHGDKGDPGDGNVVRVLAKPAGDDGNHIWGVTYYNVADVCAESGLPDEAGVLSNPNSPSRITAEVVDFQQFNPDILFRVRRHDMNNIKDEDVINADIEFYVQCLATSSEVIPAPDPHPVFLAFVTSTQYTGSLGGLAGADAKCQVEADAAGLPGTYKAWLSDLTESPATRFYHSLGGYLQVNGTVVADSWADLTSGSLQQPIMVTADGSHVGEAVWTGTRAEGHSGAINIQKNCNNWTSADGSYRGVTVFTYTSDYQWTFSNTESCNNIRNLYCFQQE